MRKIKQPGAIAQKILKALQSHPEGLDIQEIRELIQIDKDTHQHLDRRLRELDPFHIIKRKKVGLKTKYIYREERPAGDWEYNTITKTQRARALHKASGRCQMCGKTIVDDDITFHIDHKIPESWGGKTEDENLWAICSECNEGKKNYFSSFDPSLMEEVLKHKSVHMRIAQLLHAKEGEWVEADLIEFVASFYTYQDDWKKRLRELRYFGLEIKSSRRKREKRSISRYKLINWVKLPDDPTKVARQYEKDRATRNRVKRSS